MALTNDEKLAERMGLLRSHGITRSPSLMTKPMDGPWYYQQVTLGYNYRMTDLQGALGASQMTRLEKYVTRRNQLAENYDVLLKDLPLTTPWQDPDGYSARHLYVIRLHLSEIGFNRNRVFESLRADGILLNLHYIPVHTQPYYTDMGFKEGDFPEAENYYQEAFSIPMYPNLTDTQQIQVVAAFKKALSQKITS
jgi:dTDP-4-amino-4,6-dideoxygalactose transaminase